MELGASRRPTGPPRRVLGGGPNLSPSKDRLLLGKTPVPNSCLALHVGIQQGKVLLVAFLPGVLHGSSRLVAKNYGPFKKRKEIKRDCFTAFF